MESDTFVTGGKHHISPIRYPLQEVSMAFRVKYDDAVGVYKAPNNAAPDYMSNLVQMHHTREGLRPSGEMKFVELVFRLKRYLIALHAAL